MEDEGKKPDFCAYVVCARPYRCKKLVGASILLIEDTHRLLRATDMKQVISLIRSAQLLIPEDYFLRLVKSNVGRGIPVACYIAAQDKFQHYKKDNRQLDHGDDGHANKDTGRSTQSAKQLQFL